MKTNRQMLLTFVATLILAANAYAGRWLSRDPITKGAGFVQRDQSPQMEFISRNSPNLYAFVRADAINHVDPYGLDVYHVTVPSGVIVVDHHAIVGDDGKGGFYYIDFGPKNGCCGRIQGSGVYGSTFGTWTNAAGYIAFNASLPVTIQDRLQTSTSVDAALADQAVTWTSGTAPIFTVWNRNCADFTSRFINYARQFNATGSPYPIGGSPVNSPPLVIVK